MGVSDLETGKIKFSLYKFGQGNPEKVVPNTEPCLELAWSENRPEQRPAKSRASSGDGQELEEEEDAPSEEALMSRRSAARFPAPRVCSGKRPENKARDFGKGGFGRAMDIANQTIGWKFWLIVEHKHVQGVYESFVV